MRILLLVAALAAELSGVALIVWLPGWALTGDISPAEWPLGGRIGVGFLIGVPWIVLMIATTIGWEKKHGWGEIAARGAWNRISRLRWRLQNAFD